MLTSDFPMEYVCIIFETILSAGLSLILIDKAFKSLAAYHFLPVDLGSTPSSIQLARQEFSNWFSVILIVTNDDHYESVLQFLVALLVTAG